MEETKDLRATEIMEKAVSVLDSKKAQKISVIYVNKKTTLADYFVICNGNSSTQIHSLAGEIEYKLGLDGYKPTNVEGHDNNSWVLMDYDSVIIHLFTPDAREFYYLDRLWREGEEVDISSLLTEA